MDQISEAEKTQLIFVKHIHKTNNQKQFDDNATSPINQKQNIVPVDTKASLPLLQLWTLKIAPVETAQPPAPEGPESQVDGLVVIEKVGQLGTVDKAAVVVEQGAVDVVGPLNCETVKAEGYGDDDAPGIWVFDTWCLKEITNPGACRMAWFLIISSVIVLWVASLCKILHGSYSPPKGTFLNNLKDGGSINKRNVLLVVAHPDDESMFFTPTINYLTTRGHNIHILCLSIGDADGKGITRKEELYQASAILKVPHQQVKVLDHPDLQDGFGEVWNHNILALIIEEEINSYGIDLIITFDNYGVSGHCNHCDVHYGVMKLLHASSQRKIEAWELVSTNIFRKYSGPVDIWLSSLYPMQCSHEVRHCLLNEQPRKSFRAMAQHSSQWVWFRKLFVGFSSYTYVNTLRKMK
ncbi:N-acetylglucosaminyl-phosphatidylinositol de-N-acetylase-like isoform X1 [Prunus yedoensis var. nudiflora]|uniref:N-acetylglucosaminylphosphatidylinositol deacetylase n=1 Tax=Prunus yedoensis var. nudiflora TaxID=2094558 RepID=A0A314XIZ0_PRUYE|nr:N-acetylglucosaminyl-phosphatidylinositol de-N-acetylase-like isoform X1 [Prunus yedoensis var. nudiflora]